jgi:predicted membrane channel-forming protein YqfA (hemolysin III family)
MRRFIAAAAGDPLAEAAGSIFVVTNILCYGVSALYHIGKWGVNVEIFLQVPIHLC